MKILTAFLTFILLASGFAKANLQDEKRFTKVLSTYEKLHDAFFKNDLPNVKKLSKELAKNLETLEGEEVRKKIEYTKKKVAALEQAKSLEDAHKDFNVISQGLLVVLEGPIKNKSYARYYCPMVKKYWIQNITESQKVMNPYASESMPHCGGMIDE